MDTPTTISAEPFGTGTASQFDILIERWNRLKPPQREERARACRRDGHEWVNVFSGGRVVYVICRNCCAYDNDARDRLSSR